MNTLFEIANLNAIYIDAADRDDVADKIYLKNQDKVCGVVGFYDNGDIKLITDDSDIKIEFEILKRLAGFDLGCEDIYDLSEKLNNAIVELRATFEKVNILRSCKFIFEGDNENPDFTCEIEEGKWVTIEEDGNLLIDGYEKEFNEKSEKVKAYLQFVVDEYSNLRKKHNHFTACMIVLQNLGIPAYFVDVD